VTRALGWIAPEPKHLARLKHAGAEAGTAVLTGITPAPTSDLYHLCKVLDQGALGSCVLNMVAQLIRAAQVRAGSADPEFIARLAAYYWSRFQDGWQNEDSGTFNATAFDVIADLGIPPESCWPYEIEKFSVPPGPEVYRQAFDARGRIGVNYNPINTSGDAFVLDMERALTGGFPVGFGVTVSTAFCSQVPSGTIEPPGPSDAIAGGHAMTAIGHDSERRRVKVLNSWSVDWHDPELEPGCCWLSYEYLRQSRDRWIVPKATLLETTL
jgi:hypothetical protein